VALLGAIKSLLEVAMQEITLNPAPMTDAELQAGIEQMLQEMRALNRQIEADRQRATSYREHQQSTMTEVRAMLSQLRSAS
jgi:hypothetical protein